MPLLEIKDFGPPATYGEDKELTLNKKSPPSPHPSPSRGEGEEYLTPHLNPLPKERKTNINQPYGTQFHSTQLRFVGSASVLKERENAVDSASVPNERTKGFSQLCFFTRSGRYCLNFLHFLT